MLALVGTFKQYKALLCDLRGPSLAAVVRADPLHLYHVEIGQITSKPSYSRVKISTNTQKVQR